MTIFHLSVTGLSYRWFGLLYLTYARLTDTCVHKWEYARGNGVSPLFPKQLLLDLQMIEKHRVTMHSHCGKSRRKTILKISHLHSSHPEVRTGNRLCPHKLIWTIGRDYIWHVYVRTHKALSIHLSSPRISKCVLKSQAKPGFESMNKESYFYSITLYLGDCQFYNEDNNSTHFILYL